MTDTTRIPTAIEVLEAQGPTVPVEQVGQYTAALGTLKGLDYRRQQEEKRAAASEGPTR